MKQQAFVLEGTSQRVPLSLLLQAILFEGRNTSQSTLDLCHPHLEQGLEQSTDTSGMGSSTFHSERRESKSWYWYLWTRNV